MIEEKNSMPSKLELQIATQICRIQRLALNDE